MVVLTGQQKTLCNCPGYVDLHIKSISQTLMTAEQFGFWFNALFERYKVYEEE